jgi:transposase, IS30 family
MHSSQKLSKAERSEIQILLGRDFLKSEIARALGRSRNTIGYEIRENSTKGDYDPVKAHAKALVDRKYRRFDWQKIEQDTNLKAYIITGLRRHWNPDEIAGAMRQTKQPFYASKTAIYAWLRSGRGAQYCVYLYSKRAYVKKRKLKTARVMIPNRVSITKRPLGASNRTRYKHWEDDSIVGVKGTPGGLKSAQERKSRLVMAQKVESMSPIEHTQVARTMFAHVGILTMSRDNGIENKDHLAQPFPSFFCDPYSSYQKGGVENANKMIRGYFPKGTDFRLVTQDAVDHAVSFINNKPRKILGYRSALEIALKAGIIKQTSVLIGG